MKTPNIKLIKIFRSLSENIPCSDCPMGLSCPSDGCIFEDAAEAIQALTHENLFLKSVQSKLVGYVTQNELSEIISEVMKSGNVQTIQ